MTKNKPEQGKADKAFKRAKFLREIKRDRYLYLMLFPALAVTVLFAYVPMYGLIMAFQDYNAFKGFSGSEFVGLDNFRRIFSQSNFLKAIWNTLYVSLLGLVTTFPAPILLALLLNELKNGWFKKSVQTISYLPHFLSWISVVGLVNLLFGRDGLINEWRMALGAKEALVYLAEQNLFIWFILGTSLWKEVGWGTVIHLANLSSISPELYEAASIDGASRLQKIRFITLPHMVPTVLILLIFKMGSLFGSNFELIYGLQNPYIDFDVISTIVYEIGVTGGNYSVSTALGFAQGLIALILVLMSNKFSKKMSGAGIV